MKITYIQTYVNGIQLLGSDLTTVAKDLNTERKLNNAIKRHIERLKTLTIVHPCLKGNYEIKYESVYR